MNIRPLTTVVLVLLFAVSAAQRSLCAAIPDSSAAPDFRQLLQQLADFQPDPCDASPNAKLGDPTDIEHRLFEQAADAVVQQLNAPSANQSSPRDRALQSLKQLERISAEINTAWPDDSRFHSEILELPPALVVKMSIRTHVTYFVFGIPAEDSGKPNRLWRQVGSDYEFVERNAFPSPLDIYPLHRGPSGNVRFLAEVTHAGCAGSFGIEYDVIEWDPKGYGYTDKVFEQTGSFGLDDKVPGFPQIGKLGTKGPLLTLPYCWFSAIDTWDNPSLCAVDTYDLSKDDIGFVSRTYNRPDLVPIAKAIEYAQKRDYPAVLGYVASPQIARRMVREMPTSVYAEDLRVTRISKGKERVQFGSLSAYRFDVEKRAGRWIVVAFSTN